MKYVVEVRVTPTEQEMLMEQCPFGSWRSRNGLDHFVEFVTREEAVRFFDCVDAHGYPMSQVKEVA